MIRSTSFNCARDRRWLLASSKYWRKPVLRLAIATDRMDVHSRLFAGEEKESISSFAKNRRAHACTRSRDSALRNPMVYRIGNGVAPSRMSPRAKRGVARPLRLAEWHTHRAIGPGPGSSLHSTTGFLPLTSAAPGSSLRSTTGNLQSTIKNEPKRELSSLDKWETMIRFRRHRLPASVHLPPWWRRHAVRLTLLGVALIGVVCARSLPPASAPA